MISRDVFKVVIFRDEAVVTVEHDARKVVFPLILSACRNKDNKRLFKTFTLVYRHGRDLILVRINDLDISFLDLDLHQFEFG